MPTACKSPLTERRRPQRSMSLRCSGRMPLGPGPHWAEKRTPASGAETSSRSAAARGWPAEPSARGGRAAGGRSWWKELS
eukprot:3965428-Alexandrium_andersonii.AAC.1